MNKKEKKEYKKPEIVYEKKIETVAAVCDSVWSGPSQTCCMKTSCQKRST